MEQVKNLKIKVWKKECKTKKGFKFDTYFTKLKYEDGEHFVTVKFTKDCDEFKKDIKRCVYVYVPMDRISVPYKYEVIEKEDGTKTYPVVWIREVVAMTPVPSQQKDISEMIIDE